MRDLVRSWLDLVILGLLVALVATNTALLILLRTGGPLIGLAFYLVLLILTLRTRQRDYRPLVIGGLAGLHLFEVVAVGWLVYPVLMALNLVLPVALAASAWAAARGQRQGFRDK